MHSVLLPLFISFVASRERHRNVQTPQLLFALSLGSRFISLLAAFGEDLRRRICKRQGFYSKNSPGAQPPGRHDLPLRTYVIKENFCGAESINNCLSP
jgi:hypothetical protein